METEEEEKKRSSGERPNESNRRLVIVSFSTYMDSKSFLLNHTRVDRSGQKWMFGLIDEVKKYRSLWKNPVEKGMDLEKQMVDISKINKTLTIKFGKCYTPSETFAKWVEIKKEYFNHYDPDSPIHQKLKFLSMKKSETTVYFDMPDCFPTAASSRKPPIITSSSSSSSSSDSKSETPAKLPSQGPKEDPVLISLEEFDPPNIGDVVCTGTFTAPPVASYQRYQPFPLPHQVFPQIGFPYPGPSSSINGRYPQHHSYFQSPIMSQKRRRQLAQNPPYMLPGTFAVNPTPIHQFSTQFVSFSIPNSLVTPNFASEFSKTTTTTSKSDAFEDFDPEKAAEQMFFNKGAAE